MLPIDIGEIAVPRAAVRFCIHCTRVTAILCRPAARFPDRALYETSTRLVSYIMVRTPFLQAVMTDPVLLLADSHTYERSAIKAWLSDHSTSPVTGQPLASEDLVPNHALRSIIGGMSAVRL